MIHTRQFQGFTNQFVNYSGITLDNRYAVYYVTDVRGEEEISAAEPYTAGVLRYDYVDETQEFFTYGPGSYVENMSSAKEWIYYAELQWEARTAVYTIYQLNCRSMRAHEAYTLRLTDGFSENMDVSPLQWVEFHGLGQRYVLAAIPELDDPFFKKHNSGFSGYLLLDLELGQSFPVPDKLGRNDRIVHTSWITVFEHENTEQLMIESGRIQCYEKRDIWEIRKYEMIEGVAIQSVVVIPLEAFIEGVKKGVPIAEAYIIDQCNPACGYAAIRPAAAGISLYKHYFSEERSELCLYNLATREMQRQQMAATFDRLYVTEDLRPYGVLNHGMQEELWDAGSGELLFTGETNAMVRVVDGKHALTRRFIPEQDTLLLQLIDLESRHAIHSVTGRFATYSYLPRADLHIFCG